MADKLYYQRYLSTSPKKLGPHTNLETDIEPTIVYFTSHGLSTIKWHFLFKICMETEISNRLNVTFQIALFHHSENQIWNYTNAGMLKAMERSILIFAKFVKKHSLQALIPNQIMSDITGTVIQVMNLIFKSGIFSRKNRYSWLHQCNLIYKI